MSTVEQITDPHADHGEGPVWHAGWPGLRWVDMLAGDVLELDPDTAEVRRHHVGTVAAVLRPRVDGGVVLAVERGFALADAKLQDVRPLGELWTDPGIRMNEGDCDPDGRFYCGSMAYDTRPGAGAVYRLDPDGAVTTVLTGVTISNGLTWSPDDATAYYIDTPTQAVDAFDYSPETGLSNRRTLFHIPESDGAPDGMTIDTEGRLWIALWGGAAVRCYQPDGTLVEHLTLPVTQVTACTFGGPTLEDLYITTSKQDIDPTTQPQAGALFHARPGAKGRPTRSYG
ncbi:MAG TPA: SMP-30/gluconolactonase/LRE family protein [Actinophytocola sp.]|uniref:SMP-30/gluconolactonase/LRE family protein n=1 Tax=Actinophytocola sp. TaxID=1872138 RepID=UPI002DDD3F1F|nr:SMP-30/gluconolactonase/LRE family protein [Actinophytocola sp.]HEV2784040.1 SMP-30/gluconolactonase/LRE family protein [Actinophytocola sp.]